MRKVLKIGEVLENIQSRQKKKQAACINYNTVPGKYNLMGLYIKRHDQMMSWDPNETNQFEDHHK